MKSPEEDVLVEDEKDLALMDGVEGVSSSDVARLLSKNFCDEEEIDRRNAISIFRGGCEGWEPEVKLTPTEWCEKFVEEIPYSNIPGGFRVSYAPQMREVMDSIVNRRVRLVFVVASIQSSKTLSPELALSYIIANDPGPSLWLDVTDDSAKMQAESRLQTLFENCKPVKELFPLDKNKRRTRTIFFQNGMTLWVAGANNRRNLQSRSIRWLFGDETWQWKKGRMIEAEARVSAFGRFGKCVFTSQAGKKGDDTDLKFQTTDQREWCFVCPTCGEVQPYLWENVHWDPAAKDVETKKWDYQKVRSSVHMTCRKCGARFEDDNGVRLALSKTARFVPQNPNPTAGAVGFHWNALCNKPWGELAEMYLRAKENARAGNVEDLAAFYQQRLAIPWQEELGDFDAGVFVGAEASYQFGDEGWGEEGRAVLQGDKTTWTRAAELANADGLPRLRFLTADVQDGYFYWLVRMWSPKGDSRLLAYGMAARFEDLRELRDKWKVSPKLVFVDGGFMTQQVAAFCADTGATMLMGDRVAGRAFFRHADGAARVYAPLRRVRAGGKLCDSYYFSNLSCKDKLTQLRRNENEKWEIPSDISVDYIKQLGNEYRTENNAGKPLWIRKSGRPNHYFDCETMQVAAAFMTKILEGRKN